MARVLCVSGSPSTTSKSAAVLAHVASRLTARSLEVETLALRDLPAEDLLLARFDAPAIVAAAAAVQAADGVVVATPIYKAAYSGLLKVFLDVLPQLGLTGKVVLPIATGGSLAHVLSLDYALRPVLQSMNARHVTAGYFVVDKLVTPKPEGGITLDGDTESKLFEVVDGFLDALARVA